MIKKIASIFRDSLHSFEGQKEGEEVLMLLRHHPLTIILKFIVFLFLALAPLVALLIFSSFLSDKNLLGVAIFLLSTWFLLLWLGFFHALTIYSLDTVVITNKRLIDNDQLGLFNRRVSELRIERIQDVSAHTSGLIETLFKFGDVTVQTAGAEKNFVFHKISRPERIKDAIMQMVSAHHSGIKPESD